MKLIISLFLLLGFAAYAQETDSSPKGRFVISGYGDVTYQDGEAENSAFSTRFVPIFLFKVSDKLHVESEVELSLDETGEVEVELEYADIHYYLGNRTTLTAGKFLLPFGQFGPNLHPSWINKLPTAPALYGHHGQGRLNPLVPILSDTGLGLQHILPLGRRSKLFFDAFATNGPRAATDNHGDEGEEHISKNETFGEDDHELPEIEFEATSADNNNNKAIGGRVAYAYLPLLEIGGSFYSGAYDDLGELKFDAVGLDLNLIGNHWQVRSEWIDTSIDFLVEEHEGEEQHGKSIILKSADEFQKESASRDGWYLQTSLQLGITGLSRLNQFEVVGRYAEINDLGTDRTRSFGINFRPGASAVIKFTLETTSPQVGGSYNTWLAQFSYGF